MAGKRGCWRTHCRLGGPTAVVPVAFRSQRVLLHGARDNTFFAKELAQPNCNGTPQPTTAIVIKSSMPFMIHLHPGRTAQRACGPENVSGRGSRLPER